ncbi:hypothetical protein [Fodinicurvata sp. EGI_FJ10296]|uniref:hypothetical protein n=1 Tax=Fodinicurvata sp. EGI_FJ10296 TaxID=3231908 RepID=UPI003451BB22
MDTNLGTISTMSGNRDSSRRDEDIRSVPVPAKPSAAMLAEGARAGGVSVSVAFRVYQAMISGPAR